jgi:vacuolar-type H+-ATPase subunit H
MNRHTSATTAQAADEAFNRVLQAEQATVESINDCRRAALGVLRQARNRARAISQHADRRVSRVHALSDAALQRELERIEAETQRLDPSPVMTAELEAATELAISRLLREVLG